MRNPTEKQFIKAARGLSLETTLLIHNLTEKVDCNEFEAMLLARAIIHSVLDNLGAEALEEFKEFLAKVRRGEIPL